MLIGIPGCRSGTESVHRLYYIVSYSYGKGCSQLTYHINECHSFSADGTTEFRFSPWRPGSGWDV